MLHTSNHIALFSGGLASFEMTKRVVQSYGLGNVRIWFFDTLIEDEDLYRFIEDAENWLGIEIERFSDGRNPWEVFRDERFIGNSRVNLCTRVLKRELLERLLKKEYPSKNVELHFGLEDTEVSRIETATQKWSSKGYRISFPLQENPKLSSKQIRSTVEGIYKLELPRLYKMGFRHNNCGGACVKAGISQWSWLWETFPERYAWHENQEQITRDFLQKNVAILRDRNGRQVRPLTLRELRSRLEESHELMMQFEYPIGLATQSNAIVEGRNEPTE